MITVIINDFIYLICFFFSFFLLLRFRFTFLCDCSLRCCGKITEILARLWEPLRLNRTSNNIYNCSKCGRPYKTKYTLRRHERLECGLPALYKCRACDYRAKHKHSVKQHYEGVHEKKYKIPLEVQLTE